MKRKEEKPVDRRIQKTKKSLTESLIQLILIKGYESVTIQDILDKANVGRSTFYLHYESKEQLLLDGHNNLNISMFSDSAVSGNKEKEIDFLNLFLHVGENIQLAKAMIGKKSGNLMTEFIKNNIAVRIRKKFRSQFRKSKTEDRLLDFLADAAGAAVMSLLINWVDENKPFSPEEMSDRSCEMVNAIFSRY